MKTVIALLLVFPMPMKGDNQDYKKLDYLNKRMHKCMSFVNMKVINSLQEEALMVNSKVDFFCNKNDRNKAQNQAIGFAIKIQKSKDVSTLKSCEKIMSKPLSGVRKIMNKFFVSTLRYKHICDYDKP